MGKAKPKPKADEMAEIAARLDRLEKRFEKLKEALLRSQPPRDI